MSVSTGMFAGFKNQAAGVDRVRCGHGEYAVQPAGFKFLRSQQNKSKLFAIFEFKIEEQMKTFSGKYTVENDKGEMVEFDYVTTSPAGIVVGQVVTISPGNEEYGASDMKKVMKQWEAACGRDIDKDHDATLAAGLAEMRARGATITAAEENMVTLYNDPVWFETHVRAKASILALVVAPGSKSKKGQPPFPVFMWSTV